MSVHHVWLASRVCDAYYHFTVTREGRDTLVEFELASREAGHIASRIDHGGPEMVEDVDSRAIWYLDPEAFAAWRSQRRQGFLGSDQRAPYHV